MVYGNVDGIKGHLLNKLDEIYDLKVPKESLITNEIIDILSSVNSSINREISVSIDRRGNVVNVSIGDSSSVELQEIDLKENKLSGIRIIHTHPNGDPTLSLVDKSALLKMRLDCIAAIGVIEDHVTGVKIGFCSAIDGNLTVEEVGPYYKEELDNIRILDDIKYFDTQIKNVIDEDEYKEKAILVGIENEDSLEELEELAKACNVSVVDKVIQNREKIDTAYYIGKGKVEEIAMLKQIRKANVIIFDDELSGSQVRNLEDALGVKVIDRTTLILEIFANRARSREAKIQVELAQLKYRVPRLMGLGAVLSRTGGGIGTKGPGEKKLEIDRRRIKEQIYDLNTELIKIKKNREVQREKRNKDGIPKISIVGYTNAGKSTLRNKLCDIAAIKEAVQKEKVFEADMLFATLDVTTRAIILSDKRVATLTDTVGFVRKLPHDLVEAFKSTLEEVIYSDLLLHVVDCSNSKVMEQIEAVNDVLTQLGAQGKPTLLVLNKIDKADKEQVDIIKSKYSDIVSIEISAKNNINLEELLQNVNKALPNNLTKTTYQVPYGEEGIKALLHRNAIIESEEYNESGTLITALVDEEMYNRCVKFKK